MKNFYNLKLLLFGLSLQSKVKSIFLSVVLLFSANVFAQTLDQSASWPNANWTLSGTFNAGALLNDPTTTANLSYDDDAAGSGSTSDVLSAESPIIDLTPASNAGETFILVNYNYDYNLGDIFNLEYFDADANSWVVWEALPDNSAATAGWCSNIIAPDLTSVELNIAGFTANQLSNFQYRFFYDASTIWGWGFCISSPTIFSEAPPSCVEPTNLTLQTVATNTVDFTWDDVPNANDYLWEVFNAGDDPDVDTSVSSGTFPGGSTAGQATGLLASTNYDFYLTADCGMVDGLSLRVGPISFSTVCDVFTAPYFEDFEAFTATTIFTEDECWNENSPNAFSWDISDDDTGSLNTGPNSALSGINFAFTEATGPPAGEEAFLDSPLIDLSTLTTPALSFWYHMHGADMGTLNVDIDAGSGFDLAVFSLTGEQQPNQGDAWIQQFVDLSAYAGQTITIRFRGVRGPDFTSDMSIDDVSVDEAPSCFVPSNLTVSNVTQSEADFSWSDEATATDGYNWFVFNAGDDPDTATPIANGNTAAGVTTVNVAGLPSSSALEFYVQSDCGGGDLSDFSQPISFDTLCDVFVAPYFEDFGNFQVTTTFVEDGCWEEVSSGTFAWDVSTGGTPSTSTGPDSAIFGANYIFTEASTGALGDEAIVLTPDVDLSGLTVPALSFWYHMYGDDMGTLHIDVDDGTNLDLSVFSITGEQQTDNSDPWFEQIVDLSAYAGQTIQVRFRVERGDGFNSDVAIDGVRFDEAPTCFTPVNLSVANITQNTADFSWDDEATATDGYNWFVFNAGDDPDTATPVANGNVAAGVTTVSVSALPSSSFLEFYVQSNCGTSGTSLLSVPLGFETLCDVFPTPYFEDFSNFTVTTTFVEDGCWEEVSPGGFSWDVETGPTPSTATGPDGAQFGLNYIFSESSTGAQGDEAIVLTPLVDLTNLTDPALSFWYHMFGADMGTLHVDVDDGTNLDLSVFSISGPQQTATGDDWIEQFVDLSAYSGQTIQVRFRVERGDGFNSDVAIDGVNFDEAPSCLKPTGLAALNVFFDTAEVTWSGVGNATDGYNWAVFIAGDDPTVDTPVSTGTFAAGSTQGIVDGLTPETDYDVYIESNCGADGTSGFANPISITTTPLCSVPANFEVINILPDTAELNWTAIPNAVAYDWAVFNAGDDPATATPVASGSVPDTDTSVVAMGLTENTNYDAYITTDCGAADGVSDQSTAIAFLTPCNAFATPYFEDFETFTPSTSFDFEECWTEVSPGLFDWNISDDDTPSIGTGPNQALSGTNFLYTEASSGGLGDEALFVSPLIDLSSLTEPALSFWYHMFGVNMGTLNVDIDAGSGYDLAVFSLSGPQQLDQADPWIEQFVDLSAYAGQTIQVRFRAERGSGFESDISIDDVGVDEAPACLTPTGLAVSNITSSSADISWSPVGNATAGYNWFVFADGADPDVDAPLFSGSVGAGITSTSLTGLSGATDYDVYIQSDCGMADGLSELSPAVNLLTLCDIFVPDYLESFDSFVPNCWEEAGSGDPTTGPSEFDTSSWLHDGYLNSAGPDNSININLFTTGREEWIISPTIDLSGGDYILQYLAAVTDFANSNLPEANGMGSDDEVQVLITIDNGLTWTPLKTYNQSSFPSSTGDLEIIDLSSFTGNVRFAFWATDGSVNDPEDYDFFIDEFEVKVAPDCLQPLNLTATNETTTTVDISWDTEANATAGYNWFVFADGADTDVDPALFTGSVGPGVTSTTITGLSASTSYDVYVQSDCGAVDGLSVLSPGAEFQTLCDIFVAPYFTDFEAFAPTTDLIEDECWAEVSLGAFSWDVSDDDTISGGTGPNQAFSGTNFVFSEASSGSLGDEALLVSPQIDLSTLSVPALSFWYHMFGGDMGTLHVDVDAGSGFDLDVFTLTGQQQTNQGDDWIQQFVDLSTYSGQTITVRLRAERGDGFESDISIDDFRVDEAPTCFDPSNLEVLSVTDTTAQLNWTAGSSETIFDVEVVLAGSAPTGIPTHEDVTVPFTVTGLTAETDYEFYVRADCGAGDVSNWVGPESFTTVFTPTTVVVNAPAINETYCYGNDEFKEWLFVASDGTTPVEIQFTSGTIESAALSSDRFRVFDGFDTNGTVLFDSDVDGKNLNGVSLTANSGAAYLLLESDVFGSCQNGVEPLIPFDFDVFAGTVSTIVFSKENFDYYPNPVTSVLNIDSFNPVSSIQIFDISGKMVHNSNYDESSFSIDLQVLNSGTYLMKVNIGSSYNTFKLIKE